MTFAQRRISQRILVAKSRISVFLALSLLRWNKVIWYSSRKIISVWKSRF